MYSYDHRFAKAVRPAYGRDHFLVHWGDWYHILRLQTLGGGKAIICNVAAIRLTPSGCGDAMSVHTAQAESGYGPAIYDAAMEMVYPKGLTAAMGSTSAQAIKVWDYYLKSRGDVTSEPKPEDSQCKIKGRESLDHIYYKKPGKAASSMMSVEQFNKHPRVIDHLGQPATIKRPSADTYECTQTIKWAHGARERRQSHRQGHQATGRGRAPR